VARARAHGSGTSVVVTGASSRETRRVMSGASPRETRAWFVSRGNGAGPSERVRHRT